MITTRKYDLYSQDFSRHAYEIFQHIRRESPILQQTGFDGKTPIWFISRFEDVEAMLKDDQHFVLDYRAVLDTKETPARLTQGPDVLEKVNNHLLTKDGEDHRRLRSLVTQAFTPRRINDMRPRIQAIAEELIAGVKDQGHMDLVDDYAFPLPITVIAELLGIPTQDRDRFRSWSDIFVRPAITEKQQAAFIQMAMGFVGYLQALFVQRKQNPKDDLISALLQAEESGNRLTTEELISMVVLLIIAGHETTVTLIGNATVALLTHPDSRERLIQHPEQMVQSVEELLRYDAPVDRTITRIVASDVELGGPPFKRGDFVIALLGSANRDERHFTSPDDLDLERDNRSHIAFGRGVHYCLGAPLARMEAEIALNTLLQQLPNLTLAVPPSELEYRLVPLFHAYAHVPVKW